MCSGKERQTPNSCKHKFIGSLIEHKLQSVTIHFHSQSLYTREVTRGWRFWSLHYFYVLKSLQVPLTTASSKPGLFLLGAGMKHLLWRNRCLYDDRLGPRPSPCVVKVTLLRLGTSRHHTHCPAYQHCTCPTLGAILCHTQLWHAKVDLVFCGGRLTRSWISEQTMSGFNSFILQQSEGWWFRTLLMCDDIYGLNSDSASPFRCLSKDLLTMWIYITWIIKQ